MWHIFDSTHVATIQGYCMVQTYSQYDTHLVVTTLSLISNQDLDIKAVYMHVACVHNSRYMHVASYMVKLQEVLPSCTCE